MFISPDVCDMCLWGERGGLGRLKLEGSVNNGANNISIAFVDYQNYLGIGDALKMAAEAELRSNAEADEIK